MLIRAVLEDGGVVSDFSDEAETPCVGDIVWYQMGRDRDPATYKVLGRAIDMESNRVAVLVEEVEVPAWMYEGIV